MHIHVSLCTHTCVSLKDISRSRSGNTAGTPSTPVHTTTLLPRTVNANLYISQQHILLLWSESESEVAQSCPTLSDPMDCSLPGCSIHGIFQASVLEWGAIALLQLCPNLCDPRTVNCQAPLSIGFPRQEYWSVLSCPPPVDLPDAGIKPTSPAASALQIDSLPLSHWGSPHSLSIL